MERSQRGERVQTERRQSDDRRGEKQTRNQGDERGLREALVQRGKEIR